jgi:hypothetical protein
MDFLAGIWQFLSSPQATPLSVVALLIITVIYMIIKYKERSGSNSLQNCLSEVKTMLMIHSGQSSVFTEEFNKRSAKELDLLEKMTQEMVKLNAHMSGDLISTDNAKRIISYQWSWCRDETARLIQSSITYNNFMGNEELVVRRVFRAWKKIANESRESICRISGIKYPFDPLYESHLPMIWERVWEWAAPIYGSKSRGTDKWSDKLKDLEGRVYSLFDSVIETYFEMAEDLQDGLIYEGNEDAKRASGIIQLAGGMDSIESKMVSVLKGAVRDADEFADVDIDRLQMEMRRRQKETERIG